MQEIPLQDTSLEVWQQKYQLKNHLNESVDKCVDDTYRRVADALAEVEPTDKQFWSDQFFTAIQNGAIPAGRILSNAGATKYKPATSLINCTVSQIIEDSMKGILIANMNAGITLAAGCGIGYEFSTLRPRGAYVNGAGATTSGSVSFMDIFNSMCFTVSSAGGRRGAQMGTLACWHPDVEEFIMAKREDGRLRQFNLSVLIDDDFMECLKHDLTYSLVFPVRKQEIDEGIIDQSSLVLKKIFWEEEYCEKMGYKFKDGLIACKVYKTIKARELWDRIMRLTYDFADPGVLFIDRINKYNPLNFIEIIRSTNPCQPGWAKLLTKDGIKEMKDISIGDYIWSSEGWTKVINKWSSGVKKVNKYQTTAGIFYGTENHRIVSGGDKIEVKDAVSIDVLTGPTVTDITINPEDVMDGLVFGDGSVHKASNDLVHLYIGAGDTSYHTSEISHLIKKHRPGLSEFAWEVETTITPDELPLTYLRRVPTRFMSSRNKTIGFLRGIYTANGSVVGNRITLKAASKGVIEDVQLMLSSVGIRSYYTTNKTKKVVFGNGEYQCKESYDLNISIDREVFLRLIGFIQKYKEEKIKIKLVKKYKKSYEIINTEFVSEEEVFDLTVNNSSHTYWTQGVNVSNCGEQPLPPDGSCLLGSVNLTKFITEQGKFDYSAFERTVRVFTRMLDNVVEINGLPLEEQRNEIQNKRRHGMGITGLGSTLAILGIRYGSKDALQFTSDVTRIIAEVGIQEAVALAKEKGCALIMRDKCNRQRYIETPFISKLLVGLDQLKEDILEYGVRFTHHSSIAPTGTMSLSVCNNVSNGIEPSFSHKYTRNVIKEGEKAKRAVDVYSYEMLWFKTYGKGEIPDSYVTSDGINPIEHIDMQAAAQEWVDSSISKTINVPTDISFDEFKNIYQMAYDKGLKGCTTFRFNPEAFQGVLVKESDLEATNYVFFTETGKKITAKGNDTIEYDGGVFSAANLYDALKEGYYGKF